jgi:cytochrome c5
MAEVHVEEHESIIKTPKQLIVVVVLAFLIPVLGIIMIAELATGGLRVDRNSPAMSEEAVAARLKPIPVTAAPASSGAPAPDAAPGKAGTAVSGKQIYDSTCSVCHGAGIAGAPKMGDKAAWKPRIAQGAAKLYESALKGKGAMPPKGGATSTSDADIKAAVDYLIAQSK